MSQSCLERVCNGVGSTEPFHNMAHIWSSSLTHSDALSDSPNFRQTLAKTELLAAQIQAHYLMIEESCRQTIKTGEAFASALTNLARCIDIRQLPKPTYDMLNMAKLRAGLDCDPLEGLNQVQQVLQSVSNYTAALACRFKDPLRYVLEAQKQINQLFDLRVSFHKASDQLDSSFVRSASVNTSKSQSDLSSSDTNVTEVTQIYRNTATAYMTGLQKAISATPLLTYLRSNSSVLRAEQDFIGRLASLTRGESPLTETPDMLQEFLTKVINWSDTNYRMMKVQNGQSSAEPSLGVQKATAVPMEGYLFKRSTKRTWRSWARRWFRISNNQLIYCKRLPCLTPSEVQLVIEETVSSLKERLGCPTLADGKTTRELTDEYHSELCLDVINRLVTQCKPCWKIMESDLRLCTAREGSVASDRRYTFELISHGNRIHPLQADSFDQRERWIEALRSGMMLLQHTNSNLSSIDPSASSPSPIFLKPLGSCGSSKYLSDHSDSAVPGSHPSLTDIDQLRNQGGIMLWQEPYGTSNRCCADCLGEGASWASINLGVTLCTQCAASHRSLGVHISKIRSLTLDNWEPELLHLMLNLGNRLVNSMYEAQLSKHSDQFPRPTTSSSAAARLHWVRAKWVDCRFVRLPLIGPGSSGSADDPVCWIQKVFNHWSELRALLRQSVPQHQSSSSSRKLKQKKNWLTREKRQMAIFSDLRQTFDLLRTRLTTSKTLPSPRRSTLLRVQEQELAATHVLLAGAQLGCPPLMLIGLAAGAHPDGSTDSCSLEGHSDHLPPLIVAVRSGSLAACEFLLLNGADIDVQDRFGQTPLHHACVLHRVHLVCLFLRRRADQHKKDHQGRVPLDIAIQAANADIVTLLRLQRLHDDDLENDFTSASDDMVSDVFRDYTSRAYNFFDSDDGSIDATLPSSVKHACSDPLLNSPCASSSPTDATAMRSQLLSPTMRTADTRQRRRRRLMSPHRTGSSSVCTLSSLSTSPSEN